MREIRGIPFYPRHDIFWARFPRSVLWICPPPYLGDVHNDEKLHGDKCKELRIT